MTFRQDHLYFNVLPDVHCRSLYNIECIIPVYVLLLVDFSILVMQIVLMIIHMIIIFYSKSVGTSQLEWVYDVYVCVEFLMLDFWK